MREGERVTGVRFPDRKLSADAVVICTGAWTRFWEEAVGTPLPVEPVRGQMVSLEAPRPSLSAIVWGSGAYVVPRQTGTLLVGSTAERAGFDARTTAEGIAALIRGGTALLPDLAPLGFLGAWAGLRPATSDDLPLIGPVPGVRGLWVAAGHYRNGVLLSALTGLDVAASLLGGKRVLPRERFDPARFALD